jgi:hypothetical protein
LTNVIAFWLVAILIAASIADAMLNDAAVLMFAARKFLDLVEWVAFWR